MHVRRAALVHELKGENHVELSYLHFVDWIGSDIGIHSRADNCENSKHPSLLERSGERLRNSTATCQ